MSEDPADARQPPVAARRPFVREHHGDVVVDPYEWLRDKTDPEVIALPRGGERLHRRAHRAPRAAGRDPVHRAQGPHAGDRPVGARARPAPRPGPTAQSSAYWYYTRTEEGAEYARFCRAPAVRPVRTAVAGGRDRRRDRLPRRERRGRRPRLLRPRCPRGLARRAPARLLHRRHRRRALHAADPRPAHRRGPARHDPRRQPGRLLGRARPTSSTPAATRPGGRTSCCATGSTPPPPTTSRSSPSPTSGSGSASTPAATTAGWSSAPRAS